ncbi:MAG TPA: hypothetical protein VGP99_05155, partial [Tepidisphaeraceae bacterium]|nr:hypothetical protein [Tepidisphaeraceae bacterium]
GNIPGGKRDVLNSADFNNGNFSNFRVDSGAWEVQQGSLNVGAASLGKDATGVFYLDDYLPIYYEVSASIKSQKPLGGWKANAYVIFDYFSVTDFKFAGIDVSVNKFVMGHRNASGWIVDAQAPLQVKPDTFYNVLAAVNGTSVSLLVDGAKLFSYTFAPRIINGEAYGLNKGFIGAGSNSARGTWDNFAVQVLPPQLTLDTTEDFNDGIANNFTGAAAGAPWSVSAGRYNSTAASGTTSLRTVNLGVSHFEATSYLELQATLKTNGIGGIVFDENATNHFKFVALDVPSQKLLVGHFEPNRGWSIDASVPRSLSASTDYALGLTMKGASVSVTLNGAFALSWGFNAPVVDGAVGVVSRNGTTSFDVYRIRTNDPAFATQGAPQHASEAAPGSASATLTPDDVQTTFIEAERRWAASGMADASAFADTAVYISDFSDRDALLLGQTTGHVITLDDNAAGWGWFIDGTPSLDQEYSHIGGDVLVAKAHADAYQQMDLLTVLMHEMGHVLGLDDLDPVLHAGDLMAETLPAGERRLPATEGAPPADKAARELFADHLAGTTRAPQQAPEFSRVFSSAVSTPVNAQLLSSQSLFSDKPIADILQGLTDAPVLAENLPDWSNRKAKGE